MQNHHAVVWLDHHEARVFFIDRSASSEVDIASTSPNSHLHCKAGNTAGKRTHGDPAFYEQVVKALAPAHEWLITGPGSAKTEFLKHVHRHAPQLEARILGVETADHPTDPQIVAHARRYFRAKDRTLPDPRG